MFSPYSVRFSTSIYPIADGMLIESKDMTTQELSKHVEQYIYTINGYTIINLTQPL